MGNNSYHPRVRLEVAEYVDAHPVQTEYLNSSNGQRTLDGRAFAIIGAFAAGGSATVAIESAVTYPEKPIIIGGAVVSLALVGTALKATKWVILAAFGAGYTRGHQAALEEASEVVNDALESTTTPSDN